jgi:hypothetical protein
VGGPKLKAIRFAKATGDLPENVNFAIKTGALRDFLDNSAVAYQAADITTELKTPEAASNARKFTLLISCIAASLSALEKASIKFILRTAAVPE